MFRNVEAEETYYPEHSVDEGRREQEFGVM